MATTNNALMAPTRTPAIAATVAGTTLTLKFSNGKTLTVDVNDLSGQIQMDAMLNGMKQKLVDSAAIPCNVDTGRSATIDDKYEAVREVYERLTKESGTWNKQREGGTASGNTLLVRALMQLTGKPRGEIETFLAVKSKEERAALRKNPKVAEIIVALQASESDAGASDAMLEELGL
jgi:hypothetical protein